MVTIDSLCRLMFEKKASDLHLTTDAPPLLRIDGELVPSELEKLKPETCLSLVQTVLNDDQKDQLARNQEITISFELEKIGRVRLNVFRQRGAYAANFRSIPSEIPSFEDLGLPAVLGDIVQLPKGLVLVTGPTGSGKSTTLTAMVDWINRNKSVHIVTIEDPIEYLFKNQKAIINQREIGSDAASCGQALRRILRSDPDIVLIADLKDLEAVQAALNIAETGHLVFGAMESTDSVQAIYRLLDLYPPHQQFRARMQLSIALQAILAQQLLPRGYSSGRILASELLIPTSAVRTLIREEKEHQIYPLMQTGSEYGMQTMNQALFELYQKQLVTYNEIFSRTTDPRDLQQLVKGTT